MISPGYQQVTARIGIMKPHRFDKRAYIYNGTIDVASIMICLRDPV
jgi:hypothetical protein